MCAARQRCHRNANLLKRMTRNKLIQQYKRQLNMKGFSFSSGRSLILSSIGSNPIVGAGRAGRTLPSSQRGKEETAPNSTGIRATFFLSIRCSRSLTFHFDEQFGEEIKTRHDWYWRNDGTIHVEVTTLVNCFSCTIALYSTRWKVKRLPEDRPRIGLVERRGFRHG